MQRYLLLLFLFLPSFIFAQALTNSSTITITKTWSQEPTGWTYPMDISVPTSTPPVGGFPVCILLHGNGGMGTGMLAQFQNILDCHILVAPTGYLNSWNISDENSDAPDVEMVEDLINNLQTYSNVNSNQIRIIGSSNGAALSNRVFIENKNTGIDIICAIVSQLSDAQYHNGNFYYPSGETSQTLPYNGYDIVTTPLTNRKYLSICNTNDGAIPYYGGISFGVNFLDAQEAAYIVAQSQGYTGAQLPTAGTQIGTSTVYEYSYLSDQVVHLRGDAGHSTNETQKDYITDFFTAPNCAVPPASCDIPTDITTTVISGNVVRLSWDENTNAERYRIRYKTAPTGISTEVLTQGTETFRFLNGLLPNTDYMFQVKSLCATENSVWSTDNFFTTSSEVCDIPATSSATLLSSTSVTLGWSSNTADLKYKMKYKPASGGFPWTEYTSLTVNSKTETNLMAGTAYKYKLKTKCPLGWTNWSANETFSTPSSFTIPSGLTRINKQDFVLFPNPTKNIINLQLNNLNAKQFLIHDILGNVQLNGVPNTSAINLSGLNAGTYFITIITNDQSITKQFVKLN